MLSNSLAVISVIDFLDGPIPQSTMRRSVAGLVFFFLFLSACGNKGALYLPQPEQDSKQDNKPAPRK
jgi:predicted small lipoprotein YifL